MKMNRLHAVRNASGVFSLPMPTTWNPRSRSRLANRAKSLSEEMNTNPSNRLVCIRSIASITNAMSDEHIRLPALLAEGMRVREIAATTCWSENYVRWLVQQVYRKQGVSGQAALVRQVLAAHALPPI